MWGYNEMRKTGLGASFICVVSAWVRQFRLMKPFWILPELSVN